MFKQRNLIFKHAQMNIEGNTVKCENHTVQMANISRIWTGKRESEELPPAVILIIVLVNMTGIRFFNDFFAVLTVLCSTAFLAWGYMVQEKDGLHLKLCSGDVYSFISDNKFFLDQVYALLNEIITEKLDFVNYSIVFGGNGEIVNRLALLQEEARVREERAKEEKNKEEIRGKAENDKEEIRGKAENDKEEIIAKEENAKEKIGGKEEIVKEEIRADGEMIKEEKMKTPYGGYDPLISQLQTLYNAYSKKENADLALLTLIEQTTEKVKLNDLDDIKEIYGKFIESGLISECNDLGLDVLIGEIKNRIFV